MHDLKRIRSYFLFVFLTMVCCPVILFAQTSTVREYKLKAVFLFNFSQFVQWPASTFTTDNDPFVIGILGANPFGSYLDETVAGEKVNGHPLVVQYYKTTEDIKTCHILFINVSQTNKLEQIVRELKGRNILTVSDASDFLKIGGMIRLFTNNNKIQLRINLESAKVANLVISSKLLGLAEIFTQKK
jgi:hypothetical protein